MNLNRGLPNALGSARGLNNLKNLMVTDYVMAKYMVI